jgi:pimeloyl-ACP methyl ester carboxylesterase
VELHYYEKGKRGDKVVVFIHGSASDASVWLNQLNLVASRGYHGIAIDLRGHGDSYKLKKPLSQVKLDFDTHVHDVTETLEKLKILKIEHKKNEEKDVLSLDAEGSAKQKISLVTHSFGGIIAVELASRYPHLIDRLILASLPARLNYPMDKFLHALLGKPLSFIQAHLDFFKKLPLRSRYRSGILTDAQVLREIYKHVKSWNSFRKLARLQTKVYLSVGRFDIVANPVLVYKLHQINKKSEFELFKWSSHAIMEDEPEKFQKWLLDCISETID